MAKNNPDEKSVKITKISDFTDRDAQFILKYATANSSILDLGSGSGLIVNKIYQHVKRIVAVEAFQEFAKYIVEAPNVEVVTKDISCFESNQEFDIITMFGISQYFNLDEISAIYRRFYKNVKPGGLLIVKNQFGVFDDVLVSGYSEELKTNYYSHYRHLPKEMETIKAAGFVSVESVDIYPPECNRWKNTHFYAIVAYKKA